LLEGLEAVELKLSEVLEDNESFRIDSEYFKKEYLEIYNYLKSRKFKLNNEISLIKSGTTPKNRDEALRTGIVLLKTNNIRNNILSYEKDSFFYIDENLNDKMKSTQLRTDDVLINIVGATTDVIGRTALVTDNFPKSNITQAMAFNRIIDNNYLSEYLFIFLQTYFGQIQVKRLARPTGQYNLNLDEIGRFIIPKVNIVFQSEIETLVKLSHQKLQTSKTLYKQAEELLLKELDLLDFKPSNENIAIKSFSESFLKTGRLDSEYYQPKYHEILEKIRNYRGGWDYIKNEFIHIKTTFKKDKEYYNYLEIGDINISDGNYSYNKIHKNYLPANAKIKVQKNDIVISKVRPNRGAVSIIKDDDLIVSGAFTALRAKTENHIKIQTLQILLKTTFYKELLLKYNVGTSYPTIKDDDILNLEIPIIDNSIQTQIETKIKESFRLKDKSKELLELAKKAVEIAIEKDEAKAIKLLENKNEQR